MSSRKLDPYGQAPPRRRCDAVAVGDKAIIPAPEARVIALYLREHERQNIRAGNVFSIGLNEAIKALEDAGASAPESMSDGDPPVRALSEREEQPLFSTEDAARELGVSPQAVRAAARDGRLPGRRLGRAWMFDRDAVTEFKERRRGAIR